MKRIISHKINGSTIMVILIMIVIIIITIAKIILEGVIANIKLFPNCPNIGALDLGPAHDGQGPCCHVCTKP